MKNRTTLCSLAAALCLSACASAPVHYHTLLPPAETSASAQPPAPFLIELLPVGVPVQIDQPQLVIRQGGSGVAVLDGERWAGPLAEEIRTALSARLSHDLGTRDVAGLARAGDRQLVRIKLQLRRFELIPGQGVRLAADWSLGVADEAGNARLSCGASFATPVQGGYPALVEAQQALIARLAERIGADARAWSQSRTQPCFNPST